MNATMSGKKSQLGTYLIALWDKNRAYCARLSDRENALLQNGQG